MLISARFDPLGLGPISVTPTKKGFLERRAAHISSRVRSKNADAEVCLGFWGLRLRVPCVGAKKKKRNRSENPPS